MPQNLSIGCTTFCPEACSVMVKAINTGKVDNNETWQMKYIIKNRKQNNRRVFVWTLLQLTQ